MRYQMTIRTRRLDAGPFAEGLRPAFAPSLEAFAAAAHPPLGHRQSPIAPRHRSTRRPRHPSDSGHPAIASPAAESEVRVDFRSAIRLGSHRGRTPVLAPANCPRSPLGDQPPIPAAIGFRRSPTRATSPTVRDLQTRSRSANRTRNP